MDFGMQKHVLPYSFESPGKFVGLTTRPAKGSLGMTTRPNDICGGVASSSALIVKSARIGIGCHPFGRRNEQRLSGRVRACACSALPPPVVHLLDLGSRQIMSLDSVNRNVSGPLSLELRDWGRALRGGDGCNNHTLPAVVDVADRRRLNLSLKQ